MTSFTFTCYGCGKEVTEGTIGIEICVRCKLFFKQACLNIHAIKDSKCECINGVFRVSCRKCRFQKCINAGMVPAEPPTYPIGPVSGSTPNLRTGYPEGSHKRKRAQNFNRTHTIETDGKPTKHTLTTMKPPVYDSPLKRSTSISSSSTDINYNIRRRNKKKIINQKENSEDRLFVDLQAIQLSQWIEHEKDSVEVNVQEARVGSVLEVDNTAYSIATTFDINKVLELGFKNATEFANHFETFRYLPKQDKKMILSEFGIGYMLIDQASKNQTVARDDVWFLQNNTVLHVSYFLGKQNRDLAMMKDLPEQCKNHYEFVSGLLKTLKTPCQALDLEDSECVILKLMLLMTTSHPNITIIDSNCIKSTCMTHLMTYCIKYSPETGVTRFGEIILLLRSVRSAIKMFYNHTKQSDLFDYSKLVNEFLVV